MHARRTIVFLATQTHFAAMHHLLPSVVFFLLLLRISSSSSSHPFTKIYAFGDSFTDTGNYNGSQKNRDYFYSPPYGSTYFHHPAHRCSDGRLVVDFLAAALSLPFLPPYLNPSSKSSCHGVNFAVALSTSFDDQFLLYNISTVTGEMPTTLSTQLKWFESYLEEKVCRRAGPPECGEAMDGALFWIGQFGFLDYFLGLSSSVPTQIIRQQSVHNVINFLREILNKGAKHVFVEGVPPIGCLPLILSLPRFPDRKDGNGCYSAINSKIEAHNSLLEEKLQELRRHFPDAFISYVDVFGAHLSVIKEFKANGFEEPFMVCCGAGGAPYNFKFFSMCGSPEASVACSHPSKYVNWDGIHLTEAMNKRMSDLFFHGSHCRPSLSGAFLKSNGM